MDSKSLVSEHIATGWLLIASGLVFVVGGLLYTGRAIWKWPAAGTPAYLRWERGFVIAALVIVVAGLALLERMLEAGGDRILAPAGMALFLIGAAVVIVAEAFALSQQGPLQAAIVIFVVLAFLAQALFGAALLQSELLPQWVGWATLLWNLGWLVVLPIARPNDVYYPWLHYAAPLLIGLALLLKG
jgi:hypothetical protein